VHTSVNAKCTSPLELWLPRLRDQGFDSGLIRSRVSARSDHFQHVVSSFPCRCPSFCRVCEKSLVTMRNGNKSPIILYSAMLRKCKTDPESVSRTRSPSKANRFFPMVGPIITLIFNKIRLITFGVILLTDTPTNTQTVSITQPPHFHRRRKQEHSYRKQIARQLRTQYVEGINSNPMTLKQRLRVTQCH